MAKSMDTVRPIWPKDISAFLQEGEAHHGPTDPGFSPGTIVTRDTAGNLVKADLGATPVVTTHYEIVWTDGVTRADANVNHVTPIAPATTVKRYTTFVCPLIADVKKTAFTDAAATGFIVVLDGAVPGALKTIADIDLAAAAGQELVVGQAWPSPIGNDWIRVKFVDSQVVGV